MDTWVQIVLAVFSSVLASTGLWSYLLYKKEQRDKKKEREEAANSAESRMLLGLGHDRIVFLCVRYIDRGWISSDEYEDLMKYLYEPYQQLGGNGTAERLVNAVKTLPIHKMNYVQQAQQAKYQANSTPPTPPTSIITEDE